MKTRKLLSVLLALALLAAALPTAALAADEPVPGTKDDPYQPKSWMDLRETLLALDQEGAYYVQLQRSLTAPPEAAGERSTEEKTILVPEHAIVYLDLNGFVLDAAGLLYNPVDVEGMLFLTDSVGDGGLTGGYSAGLWIDKDGFCQMDGGTIYGNEECAVFNQGIFFLRSGTVFGGRDAGVENAGSFYMLGGLITGAGYNGVENYSGKITGRPGEFYMYGGAITGNGTEEHDDEEETEALHAPYCSGVYTQGFFEMFGGEISGNGAGQFYDSGVCVDGGCFITFVPTEQELEELKLDPAAEYDPRIEGNDPTGVLVISGAAGLAAGTIEGSPAGLYVTGEPNMPLGAMLRSVRQSRGIPYQPIAAAELMGVDITECQTGVHVEQEGYVVMAGRDDISMIAYNEDYGFNVGSGGVVELLSGIVGGSRWGVNVDGGYCVIRDDAEDSAWLLENERGVNVTSTGASSSDPLAPGLYLSGEPWFFFNDYDIFLGAGQTIHTCALVFELEYNEDTGVVNEGAVTVEDAYLLCEDVIVGMELYDRESYVFTDGLAAAGGGLWSFYSGIDDTGVRITDHGEAELFRSHGALDVVPATLTLTVGEEEQLAYAIDLDVAAAMEELYWETSDFSVLRCEDEANGRFSGVKAGQARVLLTVYTADSVYTAACDVTVRDAAPAPYVGGSGETSYAVTVAAATNGRISADRASAPKGAAVKLTATPDEGYEPDTVTVKGASGAEIAVTEAGGVWSFTMPGEAVTATATFKAKAKTEEPKTTDPLAAFGDLDPAAWYADGVRYVLGKGYMDGTGKGVFQPDEKTTRAMVATVLWRMAGSPVVNYAMPFADVAAGAWYAEAVRWAASQKIVEGWTDDATGKQVFAPDGVVTREQFATMLYRYAKLSGKGFQGMWSFRLDFPDVGDVSPWATEAMSWMVMNGVINGVDGKLAPRFSSTRAQVAAMLQRYDSV